MHVSVPADFFRSELRVYGDWRAALARELLQNAVDAGPTRIDVTFENVDGRGRVRFADDGHGMSRQTLEDVFFALGRSTKTGAGSIGGFGRARIIICFAQHAYQIRTGTLQVDGHGGEYTISETSGRQRGTEFVIDLIDDDAAAVQTAFTDLLGTCTLAVPVTINGVAQPARQLPPRAARVMRDRQERTWGRVYVGRMHGGRMLVRVHGLTMFSRWLPGWDDVILELAPARSREVLAASRDTLASPFSQQLDEFISDLSRNRRKALRPPAAPLDVRVGGGGFFSSENRPAAAPSGPAGGECGPDADGEDEAAGDVSGAGAGEGGTPVMAGNAAARERAAAYIGLGQSGTARGAAERNILGFDVFLMADTSDARVRRLAKAWNPAGWDATNGARRRALLLTWKAAVGAAVDALLAVQPDLGQVLWTVGLSFDTDSRAVHRTAGDGHVLALNPVTDAGAIAYRIGSRADRRALLATAAHEVAHVVADGHDEQFASVLTALYAQLDPTLADRAMRSV